MVNEVELEFTYQPVDNFNKYGMTLKKVIYYEDKASLEEQTTWWQTFVRRKVQEQIAIDRKAKEVKKSA